MLSVLIVGCGNIAGGFDSALSPADWPVTHAGAYRRDGRFKISACVEPDDARRQEFMATWAVENGYRNIAQVVERGLTFDVVSICSPTVHHAADLEAALLLQPKAVLCEKPVTASAGTSEGLVLRYREAGVPLAVNYNRRWDPTVNQLREEISRGEWGPLRSATAVYNKGVSNNGSHMVDLLLHLFGAIEVLSAGATVEDFFENDPTVPACLREASGAPIYLTCGHAADFSLFELNLVFAKGTVALEDGGERWRTRRVVPSERFSGYRVLDAGEFRRGGDEQTMTLAIDNLYRSVTSAAPLASTGVTALAAQRLCEEIRNSAGHPVASRLERTAE